MTIDYDSLERMHKQESWTADQQRHFEHGWEAGQRAMKLAIVENKDRLCDFLDEAMTYSAPEPPAQKGTE